MQALKPTVADKSESEAVNLLLYFVQTAFGYQVDDQQFGREKTLFPDPVPQSEGSVPVTGVSRLFGWC